MTLRGLHLSLKRLNLLAKLRIWVDLRRIPEKLSRNNSVRTEGKGNEGEQTIRVNHRAHRAAEGQPKRPDLKLFLTTDGRITRMELVR